MVCQVEEGSKAWIVWFYLVIQNISNTYRSSFEVPVKSQEVAGRHKTLTAECPIPHSFTGADVTGIHFKT